MLDADSIPKRSLYITFMFLEKKIGNLTRSWIPTNTKLADMCVDIYM